MLTTVAIARRATSWRLRRGGRGASLSTTAPAGASADLQVVSRSLSLPLSVFVLAYRVAARRLVSSNEAGDQ